MNTQHIRYVSLTTVASLESYITETVESAKTLKDKIQIASVAVLMHIGKHGDWDTGCRLANRLVNELGKGIQTKALADWFAAFGGLLADDKKSFASWDIQMLKARFNASAANPKAIREGAKGTHWCTFAPENPWAGFDLDTGIAALIKKSKDALDKASNDESLAAVVSVDLAKLQAIETLKSLSPEAIQAFLDANSTPATEQETFP